MDREREWVYTKHSNVSTTLIVPYIALQACTRTHTLNNQDPEE